MPLKLIHVVRSLWPVLALALALPAAAAPCIDNIPADPHIDGQDGVAPSAVDPRAQLQALVRDAVARSKAVGAAKLMADAANSDTEDVKAGRLPQVSASGSLGNVGSQVDGITTAGRQARAGLNISQLLYDGGRLNRLADWRTQLAEAARQGQLGLQEQVTSQAVSLALERSRYRQQALVYHQYARKMSCLVEALQQIVQVDKGRASELVQARKSLQQAELSQVQATSAMRQMEARLRRFVGDQLPSGDGIATVFTRMPSLEEIQAQAERASEIAQLDAQARAAGALAESIAAQRQPQVNWSAGGSKAGGVGNPNSWSVGVNVSVPIYNPSQVPQIDAARKRADAARLQRDDALEARKSRVSDVHEQASSSFDRARRIVEVLRDSDRVRNYTLQQWQQLGRRSLFDVMAAEGDHYGLRVAYVNALYDAEQANALLWSLGGGLYSWLQ